MQIDQQREVFKMYEENETQKITSHAKSYADLLSATLPIFSI